jgi:hypothetical protein
MTVFLFNKQSKTPDSTDHPKQNFLPFYYKMVDLCDINPSVRILTFKLWRLSYKQKLSDMYMFET